MRASTSAVFTSGRQRCTLAHPLTTRGSDVRASKIFKSVHLNLRYMATRKQAVIHTRLQCTLASVGLAQARLNKYM